MARRQPGLLARHRRAQLAASVLILTAATLAFLSLRLAQRAANSPPVTPSIAVLPFVDMSPEKDQEYFSDGLAEELRNSLVKIQGLHVAARTSSFQFKRKNEDLRIIGQKLNVTTVLEGSVRKQGQRVRISVQLIQVSDGFHIWSETYDRHLTDIFAVQEEIARSVAGSLRVTLGGEKRLSAQATNIEAYNAYLQGRYSYALPNREGLKKAIAYYEQATRLDPDYAPAWAALSRAHSFLAEAFASGFHVESFGSVDEEIRKSRDTAKRALALDPGLAGAHAAMGWIKKTYDWDWAGADASYQRALALEPGNVFPLWQAARRRYSGAGTGSRHGQDENWSFVDLRSRRPLCRGQGGSRGLVCILA